MGNFCAGNGYFKKSTGQRGERYLWCRADSYTACLVEEQLFCAAARWNVSGEKRTAPAGGFQTV